VFSVTSDVTAGATYQAAPPKPALPDPSPTPDSFAALIDGNPPANSASPPAPDPASTPASQWSADAAPPSSNGAASESTTSNQSPAANTSSDPAASTVPPTDTKLAPNNSTGNANPAAQSGAKFAASKPAGAKPADKTTTDTGTPIDSTANATQPTPAATVIAAAVIIPVAAAPVTVTVTPPTSTNSTAPLAIAAAAIAATSSTSAALTPPPLPGKGAPKTASTATSMAGATKSVGQAVTDAPVAKPQDAPADPGAVADEALGTDAPGGATAKATTGFLAQTSAQTNAFAAPPNAPDPSAKTTTISAANQTTAPQPIAGGKGDTTSASIDGAPSADAGTPSPAAAPAASRDHISTDANAQAPTTSLDAGSQNAAAITQLQPSSPSPTVAPAFTVTAATGAPVPVNGLAVEIAASVQSGKTRFELRLDPADLGRIDVRIDVDRNGQVTSHLTVEKPETLSMLQQDAPQLQQALNDAGLKTGSGGLQFSLRDQSSSGQNSGNQANGNAQQLVISEDDSVPAAIAGQSYGRMLGSSGGIDIRV
jgi:flagellar hook-length control protein FliK